MKANSFFFLLLSAGILVAGCGSSSGGTDAGPPAEGGGKDVVEKDVASKDHAVPTDTGGGCTGLDAAATMIMYSATCAACVTAHCCSQAQACAGDPDCISVVMCQLSCIHDGGVPLNCAEGCIAEAGSSASKSQATGFDTCLNGSCGSSCVTK